MTDLVSRVGGSQNTLSKHLGVLVEHGIVECRAEGTWHYYSCKSEDAKAVIRCWMISSEMTCFLGTLKSAGLITLVGAGSLPA